MSPTRFKVEFCGVPDAPAVKRFIHEHWQANHILSVDHALFHWQHFDRERNRYAFVLARDDDGTIVGIMGYICDGFFRKVAREGGKTIWLAIWKVLEGARYSGLGLQLRDFIEVEEAAALIAGVGLNSWIAPLYRAFGYEIGVMDQHYLLSPTCRQPQLVRNFDGRYDSGAPANLARSLARLEPDELSGFVGALPVAADVLPVKDFDYLEGRYVNHPTYGYHFYGVRESGKPLALLVMRRAEANGTGALRIVDVVGPETALEGLRSEFQAVLAAHKAEYADLYCFGFSAEGMGRAGFLRLDPRGPLILPNYFEPFTSANVQLTLAYKLRGAYRYIAFKGDADQDRPNLLRQTKAPE